MTDPSTGTPLTRRAARAAAEASRSSDAAAGESPASPAYTDATRVRVPASVPASRNDGPVQNADEPLIGTPSGQRRSSVALADDDDPFVGRMRTRGSVPTTPIGRPPTTRIGHPPTTSSGRPPVTTVDDPFAGGPLALDSLNQPAKSPHRRTSNVDVLGDAVDEVRTAARRRALRVRGLFTVIAAGILLVGGTIAVTAAAIARPDAAPTATHSPSVHATKAAAAAAPASTPSTDHPCDIPAFTTALAAHDTEAAVKAAGGGATFRTAVTSGNAPCVHLDDPLFTWVVVNKQRPFQPKDYAPTPLVMPANVRDLGRQPLRADAAAGLSNLVAAAKQAGAGELAINSGYRSYQTQVGNYGVQVRSRGTAGADLVSARPGFSEHQSGLATDVEPCSSSGRCSSIDSLAGTSQDRFILDHGWEYGFIVRYEAGHTPVSGYAPEPWHLRFIGVELAKAYHDGGFRTLEEFFGLPAAPTY